MLIQAIDNRNDLFTVKDIISDELMTRLSKEIIESIPYTKQGFQSWYNRRLLTQLPGSVLSNITSHIQSQKDIIGEAIRCKVKSIASSFWYDQEGFTMSPHIDNPGVQNVMQIYLNDCADAGTVFYNILDEQVEDRDDDQHWYYKGPIYPTDERMAFDFTKNNGYIMMNHRLQLHGVPHKLGKEQKRLSVYCYIS